WEWWAADPPGTLRPWSPGESLPVGVHDVWCRRPGTDVWRFQLHLNEADGDEWVSRRDAGIRRPLTEAVVFDAAAVPVLAPEIQLLMKARTPRPKDEADLAVALPHLDRHRRAWLTDRLPADHRWRRLLAPVPSSADGAGRHRPAVQVLDHRDPTVAERLVALQQVAYRVEADLLGTDALPPLHESVADVQGLDLVFIGIGVDPVHAALGYRVVDDVLDIDRLMVAPGHHRRGLGRRLLGFTLAVVPHAAAEVSTGAGNVAARRLYEGCGFVEVGHHEPVPGLVVVAYRRAA
ncbi:MAG: GNAT family N-acetyltransferase, partial [Egicoccus sp.]